VGGFPKSCQKYSAFWRLLPKLILFWGIVTFAASDMYFKALTIVARC